jgi:pyruvate formate lyase activating enzyme
MVVGGFQSFSLIDYPGKICAIVFTQGCNFRCPYCHNPELVEFSGSDSAAPEEDEILAFLEKRKGRLDALTITGGEPLLQSGLNKFLSRVKALGYLIKLDTNGSLPSRLEEVIKNQLIDYVAMDIKSPLDKYERVIRAGIDTGKILESVKLIMESGVNYEFRTTVVKDLLCKDDFLKIGPLIKNAGLYVLQRFVPSKTLDKQFVHSLCYSDKELEDIREMMEGFVCKCIVR